MALRSFILGSALALTSARALLVVPEVDSESSSIPDEFASLDVFEAQAAQQVEVDLLCTECPFAIQSGDETYLSLEFKIDDGFLLANDRQIFPPTPPSPITAVQRQLLEGEESEPVPLGYAVEMMPLPSPPEEPFDMVEVRFTVLDLDGYPVPLDTIAITLIHDAEGTLYIAGTDTEETADRASWRKCGGKSKCLHQFLLHRIRSMFAAAKERLIGMFKGQGCSDVAPPPPPFPPKHHGDFDRFPPKHHDDFDRFQPFDGDDAPHRGPHGHHGHHRPLHAHDKFHKTWERTLHRVMRFIVVPAVLGVLAGLAASVVGMLVGQLAVFMWRRYRRTSSTEAKEEGSTDEKEGLITESTDDFPPAYNDDEALAEQVANKA
ncbi:hypothetical protein BDW59DRAFT_145179 [Aspergillus cavernicola]|uniref:DUF7728 domain-containing protein n=1 Tax=Aspergillus cavernicola TaxID=176166 RepID=A0ABR4IFB6_9EURO